MKKILALVLVSCGTVRQGDYYGKEKYAISQEQAMRDFAMCYCIYETSNFDLDSRGRDGSFGVYIENSTIGVRDIDSITAYVGSYLDTVQIRSFDGSSLGVHKCIKMYNSRNLRRAIRRWRGD